MTGLLCAGTVRGTGDRGGIRHSPAFGKSDFNGRDRQGKSSRYDSPPQLPPRGWHLHTRMLTLQQIGPFASSMEALLQAGTDTGMVSKPRDAPSHSSHLHWEAETDKEEGRATPMPKTPTEVQKNRWHRKGAGSNVPSPSALPCFDQKRPYFM